MHDGSCVGAFGTGPPHPVINCPAPIGVVVEHILYWLLLYKAKFLIYQGHLSCVVDHRFWRLHHKKAQWPYSFGSGNLASMIMTFSKSVKSHLKPILSDPFTCKASVEIDYKHSILEAHFVTFEADTHSDGHTLLSASVSFCILSLGCTKVRYFQIQQTGATINKSIQMNN